MADQKCPIHDKKLQRPLRKPLSFSWATGYSSLENLAPIMPVIVACPERDCDYQEEWEE